MRFVLNLAPMLALFAFAFGMPVHGQNLFEQHAGHEGREDAPLTAAQRAAGDKESIFCPTMKTGQVCTHGTAAILGLTGKDAEEWTVWARKYNQTVNQATEQLFQDASTKLNPKQMELLKAWFAIGWNNQINAILYGKSLDKLDSADLESVKQMQKK
jgi:hypothetical protein